MRLIDDPGRGVQRAGQHTQGAVEEGHLTAVGRLQPCFQHTHIVTGKIPVLSGTLTAFPPLDRAGFIETCSICRRLPSQRYLGMRIPLHHYCDGFTCLHRVKRHHIQPTVIDARVALIDRPVIVGARCDGCGHRLHHFGGGNCGRDDLLRGHLIPFGIGTERRLRPVVIVRCSQQHLCPRPLIRQRSLYPLDDFIDIRFQVHIGVAGQENGTLLPAHQGDSGRAHIVMYPGAVTIAVADINPALVPHWNKHAWVIWVQLRRRRPTGNILQVLASTADRR